jgi:hypothetical protein
MVVIDGSILPAAKERFESAEIARKSRLVTMGGLAACVGETVKYIRNPNETYFGKLINYNGVYAIHQPDTNTKSDVIISSVKFADNRIRLNYNTGELTILAGENN